MAIFNADLLRFLCVGVGSNVINFVVYLLVYSIGVSLFAASAAGYLAGLFFSYHFGRIWVFGSKFDASKENVFRFVAVYAVGGLGMSIIIEVLARSMGMDYRISWFIGAAFAVINNFVGLKWLVFSRIEVNNGN
jgi:putative flippase GtrA